MPSTKAKSDKSKGEPALQRKKRMAQQLKEVAKSRKYLDAAIPRTRLTVSGNVGTMQDKLDAARETLQHKSKFPCVKDDADRCNELTDGLYVDWHQLLMPEIPLPPLPPDSGYPGTLAMIETMEEKLAVARQEVSMPRIAYPAVDGEDVLILRVLAAKHPVLCTLSEIESGTLVSRKTVGNRLTELIKNGLVERPRGKKQGIQATIKGMLLLKQCDAKAREHVKL